jgi:proteic killer suppression protein
VSRKNPVSCTHLALTNCHERSPDPERGLLALCMQDGYLAETGRRGDSNRTLDVTRNSRYSLVVILGYRDKGTRDFAFGKRVKAFSGFERSARLKLDRLEAATSLRDLVVLPGNRFEALIGDRKGQYSIRINDQWRVCFEWDGRSPGPSNVEIVDYH